MSHSIVLGLSLEAKWEGVWLLQITAWCIFLAIFGVGLTICWAFSWGDVSLSTFHTDGLPSLQHPLKWMAVQRPYFFWYSLIDLSCTFSLCKGSSHILYLLWILTHISWLQSMNARYILSPSLSKHCWFQLKFSQMKDILIAYCSIVSFFCWLNV